jgi:hypothetical protein
MSTLKVNNLTDLGDDAIVTAGALVLPAGSILQVVSTTKTDAQSAAVATGATLAVTNFTASITPSSTASKIIVNVDISGSSETGPGWSTVVKRNGTAISVGGASSSRTRVTFGGAHSTEGRELLNASAMILDAPATTSEVSYTVEILSQDSVTRTLYVNRSRDDDDAARGPRSASRITLMEVAG